jgi:hypothetical protein
MKKSDTGDFSVLYVEPADNRDALFPVVAMQKKPVVLILAERCLAFQRPDDFTALKHLKRQYKLLVIFVIPQAGQLAHLAARNGFPTYLSIDHLMNAISAGQLVRQRTIRTTTPLEGQGPSVPQSPRRTIPLPPLEEMRSQPKMDAHHDLGQQGVEDIPPYPIYTPPPPPPPPSRISRPLSSSGGIASPMLQRVSGPLPQGTSGPLPQVSLMSSAALYPPPDAPRPVQPDAVQFPPLHPTPSPEGAKRRRTSLLVGVLIVALVFAIVGSALLWSHATQISPTPAVATPIAGQLAFTSSGQVNATTSQGIEDQITIGLQDVPAPAAGQKYYVWLLPDQGTSDPLAVSLGTLQVSNGNAKLFYGGDANHDNLLQMDSRVLVTEESDAVTPVSPSPNTSTWKYYGAIPDTVIPGPDNPEHFTFLDHLRHLLALDPTLNEFQLPGGLNNWMYQNTGKVLEWSNSTRGNWETNNDPEYTRRMAIRILEYLDGTSFMNKDLPKGTPILVDERLARVGILNMDGPDQEPPDYIDHINMHMQGLLQAPSVTPAMRDQVASLVAALNNINHWLTLVHQDAATLVKMNDTQLKQPATLAILNDMIANANYAYVGQTNPLTNQTLQGETWLHNAMQALATITIMPIKPNSGTSLPQIGSVNVRSNVELPNLASK